MSDPTVVPLRRPDTIADPPTAFIAEHGRMAWQNVARLNAERNRDPLASQHIAA